MRELGISEDAALAIADGRVLAVGRSAELRATVQAHTVVDAGGRAVIPGFVDPHTHLPWAGHRAAEFELRIGGADLHAHHGGRRWDRPHRVRRAAGRRWRHWWRKRAAA